MISSSCFSSIRAMCGLDSEKNCVHGSDSIQSAQREISFFFGDRSSGQFLYATLCCSDYLWQHVNGCYFLFSLGKQFKPPYLINCLNHLLIIFRLKYLTPTFMITQFWGFCVVWGVTLLCIYGDKDYWTSALHWHKYVGSVFVY